MNLNDQNYYLRRADQDRRMAELGTDGTRSLAKRPTLKLVLI